MLICQPPPKSMEVVVSCCSQRFAASSESITVVKNSRGLTIGDLYDAMQKLLNRHRLCPHAPIKLIAEDGTVNSDIFFHTSITLDRKDPLVLERMVAHKRHLAQMNEQSAKEAKLEMYRHAKLRGKSSTLGSDCKRWLTMSRSSIQRSTHSHASRLRDRQC